jgi:hypothetical protein
MATTYKILGRVTGGPSAPATAYTVPTGKVAVISSLVFYNANGGAITFSLYISDGTTQRTLTQGSPLATNSRMSMTYGLVLEAGWKLLVNGSGSVALHVFGSEMDI